MFRVLPALTLLTLGLAGCLDGSDDGSDPTTPLAMPPGAADETGDWSFQLCDWGYRTPQSAGEEIWAPADRSCDFRVTKPLVDPDLFDWREQHGPGNEVSLAVNPTDPLNLIGGAKDYTVSYISEQGGCGEFNVWMGQFWSRDGGRTWGNDLIPGFPGDDRDSPLAGNTCNTDPVMVFDSDGTAWFNALNYRGLREDSLDVANPAFGDGIRTGSQIYFARSPDGGETYDRITFASFGDNQAIFNDKNWMAVDPNSDHMIHTWTNFIGLAGVIMFVESWDGGVTWTPPLVATPGVSIAGVNGGQTGVEVPAAFVQFSMPHYDSEGNIWIIWTGINGPVLTQAIRSVPNVPSVFQPARTTVAYPDGGLTGGADGCLAGTDFRASVYPVMGIDTSGGEFNDRIYISYPAAGATGAGVWVTSSDDGLAWTDPMEITTELDDDQFMSWIDVGPDGTVHVAYYDCSVGADDDHMTLSWQYSADGGATWSTPVHVGQVPFHGDLGHHQSGAPFIGDYNAVDASETGVHFFWADTRHTGVEGEGRAAGSDVYAATILKSWDDAALYAPELA